MTAPTDWIDYHWLAERFVLDELDDDETLQCERLLESDAAFRNAVAQAAELFDAITQVARMTSASMAPPRRWKAILAGATAGIAASVLVASAIWAAGWMHFGPLSTTFAAVEVNEDPSLASHWFDNKRSANLSVPDDAPGAAVVASESAEPDRRDAEQVTPINPWLIALAGLGEPDVESPDDGS